MEWGEHGFESTVLPLLLMSSYMSPEVFMNQAPGGDRALYQSSRTLRFVFTTPTLVVYFFPSLDSLMCQDASVPLGIMVCPRSEATSLPGT